ncbi:hypothetical protein MASR1M45_30170 [Candidatus Kapaibacterium sp.]
MQFYIFAVIGTDLFGKYEPDSFGSILSSMKTLFFVSFEGWSWVYDEGSGIKKALDEGMSDAVVVTYFISFVLLAAMIFLNLFIGILTSEIGESKLEENKSFQTVYKSGHTLILGWSQQIFAILDNLLIANQSESRASIVILANKSKQEMNDEISFHIPDFKHVKLSIREGIPTNLDYLKVVRPEFAKSVIILSQDEQGKHDDVNTIKQILALNHAWNESKHNSDEHFNVIADLDDNENAKMAKELIGNNGIIISTEEMVAKIISQAAINSGLSKIYEQIIGFDGSEIYIADEPKLIGKSFYESLFIYDSCVPIGIWTKDGSIKINPDYNTIFEKDDQVIILSEDDSTIKIKRKKDKIDNYFNKIALKDNSESNENNLLIIGWNHKGELILNELVSSGLSKLNIHIITDSQDFFDAISEIVSENNFSNISYQTGKTSLRKDLIKYNISKYQHIIVLSNYNEISNFNDCDSSTILKIINLRLIQKELQCNFNLAAELLIRENEKLVSAQMAGDFIVGPDIVSAYIAQISEDKRLFEVYNELFSNYGSEIYVRELNKYFEINSKIDFYAVTEACSRRNEIALGYLTSAGKAVVNPQKSDVFTVEDGMKVYVVAINTDYKN